MGQDLQTYCIKNGLEHLLEQWHPTKNGDLKPTNVTARSSKKVYWLLPYYDPITGKHFNFEWPARIADRVNGAGCPYLTGQAVWPGFNDLATTHPELAKEWHPTKNGNLKPTDVAAGCHKKVWWMLPYDDSLTGKHHEFEWEAVIQGRTQGRGCPYLTGGKAWKGFNDLATTHPELAEEWHPTKNDDLTPSDVTAGSNKIVWWYLLYDAPDTGKHLNFEWSASINTRASGTGCPYLSGKAVWKGFNDLATTHSELAKEWHPTKNGDLTPSNITAGSNKKTYWICPIGHTYKSAICDRSFKSYNCPVCSKENTTSFPEQTIYYYIKQYFPDAVNGNKEILHGTELDIYIPSRNIAFEYDGVRWHQDTKRDINKNILCNKKRILLCRIRETGCPDLPEDKYLKIIKCVKNNTDSLSKAIHKIGLLLNVEFDINIERDHVAIYNQYITGIKENSLAVKYPELTMEWDYEKNKNLTPEMVNYSSNMKVHWILSYDDPYTGKHFDFKWKASINSRISGTGCPYLSGKAVWKGFNDLAATHPELAKEWHPTRNGDLSPSDVTAGSGRIVWWYLLYDEPDTGKHLNFEWPASISTRAFGTGCPYLSGKAVWKGFNDLAATHPELAKEWHPTKNGNLTPSDVTAGSNKKIQWYLPYDDPVTKKHFDFEWKATIYSRVNGNSCPYLIGKKVWKGFNDLATTHPELAKEWHPTKNGDLTPSDVTAGSGKKVWWIDTNGKIWKKRVCNRRYRAEKINRKIP